jgi:hypothetical protein
MNSNLIRGTISGLVLFVGSALAPAVAAPILQGTPTSLTGVDGLVVGGNTYNATFVDGTCASVYGVCDVAHFTFTTAANALDAASAILAAIAGSYFDSNVGTVGCTLPTHCVMLIPYTIPATTVVYASNALGPPLVDGTFIGAGDPNFDLSLSSQLVYVVFSEVTTEVPEPLTLTIFGLGLTGAVAMRRRMRMADKLKI